MEAGFAKVDITPIVPCLLGGYAGRTKHHDGVQAPLFVRCCRLRSAGGARVTLFSGDLLWFRGVAGRIREAVANDLGDDPSSVFVCGIHSHSAPSTDRSENAAWVATLESNCRLAAALAEVRRMPVTAAIRQGESRVNINRRQPNDGREYFGPERNENPIRLGQNPDGPVDYRLRVIEFRGEENTIVGSLLHYACHGTGLWDTNYEVSPDWMGNAVQTLEERGTLGTVLYVNGAAANLDPVVAYQNTFDGLVPLVARFADDVESVARGSSVTLSDGLSVKSRVARLPHKSSAREQGLGRFRNVPLRRLDLGELRMVFFPGELFCQTGLAVSADTSDANASEVAVITYADESDAGYVPVREAYDAGGYEVRASPYADDAEEVLRAVIHELLK